MRGNELALNFERPFCPIPFWSARGGHPKATSEPVRHENPQDSPAVYDARGRVRIPAVRIGRAGQERQQDIGDGVGSEYLDRDPAPAVTIVEIYLSGTPAPDQAPLAVGWRLDGHVSAWWGFSRRVGGRHTPSAWATAWFRHWLDTAQATEVGAACHHPRQSASSLASGGPSTGRQNAPVTERTEQVHILH